MKETTTYRLPKQLIKKIRVHAAKNDLSYSNVVRKAVEQYLTENDNN